MKKRLKGIIYKFLDGSMKELAGNTAYYILTPIIMKIIQLVTTPIKLNLLTTAEYGILAVMGSTQSIISTMLLLSLHNAITRYYYKYKGNDFKRFFGSVLIFLLTFDVAIILLIVSKQQELGNFVGLSSDLLILVIIRAGVSKPLQFRNIMFRLEKQSKQFAYLQLIYEMGNTFGTLLFIYLFPSNRIIASTCFVLAWEFVFMIYSIGSMKKYISIKLDLTLLKEALKYSLPLVPFSISGFILNQSDKIMINKMIGAVETGMYSFAYLIYSLFIILTSSIDSAWTPTYYSLLSKQNWEEANRVVIRIIKFVGFFVILIILFTKEIAWVIGGNKYIEVVPAIPVLLYGGFVLFCSNRYTLKLMYEKKTAIISINTIICAVVNVVLNLLIIPKLGYIGAAITTAVSYQLTMILQYIYVRIKYGNKAVQLRIIIIYLAMVIAAGFYVVFLSEIAGWLDLIIRIGILLLIVLDQVRPIMSLSDKN